MWYRDDMNTLDMHREASKELAKLPQSVQDAFEVVEATLFVDVYATGIARKRESGWGKRTVLVAESRAKTTFRIAWEVLAGDEAIIWAYGPHEGFYARLARRARK